MSRIFYLFVLIAFLSSCIGAIDKMPRVKVDIKNDQKLIIDSICLIDDTIYDGNNQNIECITPDVIKDNRFESFWHATSFRTKVYLKNNSVLISNSAIMKTYEDYYDLSISEKKADLKRTGDDSLKDRIFLFFLLVFSIIVFKVLPSLFFLKPVNKLKYVVKFSLLNIGYWILIIACNQLISTLTKNGVLSIGIFMLTIVAMLIVDFRITKRTFRNTTTDTMLVLGFLIPNLIFFVAGLQILFLYTVFS